ncbi:MAG: DUF4156 domain-containing protein [Planctomycetota bacterium]|jgi:hypothetical protein
MRTTINILLVAAVSLIVSSCATPKLSAGGEKVRILAPDEVSSCKQLGKTNTSVTDSIAGIKRPPEALERELAIIARNSADGMGGDTIVPLTVIEGGRQTFLVYKCINPGG